MCLGIPGTVIETFHDRDLLMGKVDFGGVCKRVCLEHVCEVQPGQYVIVHVGFALSIIDEQEARFVFDFLEKMNELDELNEASRMVEPSSVPTAQKTRSNEATSDCDRTSRDAGFRQTGNFSASSGQNPGAAQRENAQSATDPESAR